MGVPVRQIDVEANRRAGLRVIAVILLLLGILAVAYGFSQLHGGGGGAPSNFTPSMNDASDSGTDFTSLFMIGAGSIAILAGLGCLSASLSPKSDLSLPSAAGLTCGACGLLNEPGASTCETCGEPLRA